MHGREALQLYLASRAYSPASLLQRRSILGRFCEAFDVEHDDAEAFLRWWQSTERLSPASRRSTLQAVSGYLSWLVAAGVRDDNPAELVRAPRVPRTPPKTLTDAQVDALRAEVAGTRAALPVELMLTMGLRRAEVVAVRPEHVVDGDWLEVHGKGGKVAAVPLSATVRQLWDLTSVPWPWSGSTLHTDVTGAMRRAGIDGHTAHSLRRTCATRLADQVPMHVVAAVMRHDGTATTTRHYTAVSREAMRMAVA